MKCRRIEGLNSPELVLENCEISLAILLLCVCIVRGCIYHFICWKCERTATPNPLNGNSKPTRTHNSPNLARFVRSGFTRGETNHNRFVWKKPKIKPPKKRANCRRFKSEKENISKCRHTRGQFEIVRLCTATAQLGMEWLARAFSHFYMQRACCARRRRTINSFSVRAVCVCVSAGYHSTALVVRPRACSST